MDFPDPEEEYELQYQEEMELMREMEEEAPAVNYMGKRKSKQSLDFSEVLCNGKTNSNISLSDKTNEQDVPSGSSKRPSGELLRIDQDPSSGSSKRTVAHLFGDISDLEFEELNYCEPKRQKTEIISLKKNKIIDKSWNKNGTISESFPSWAFMTVRTEAGERYYVKYNEKDNTKILKDFRSVKKSLLGESYQIMKTAALKELELREKFIEEQLEVLCDNMEGLNVEDSDLWVERYKPKTYLDLLSDEGVNRSLLNWLKLWDKIVFNREKKVKPKHDNKENKPFHYKYTGNQTTQELDEDGSPHFKMALLCGPPGLGKTTLAHIIATIAGYNVVEVNASDDRTVEAFKNKLEAATQMKSVMGNEKPNCLILDEIDGAPSAAIEFLIKYVHGKISEKGKKGKKDKPKIMMKRPVICICNEPYSPSLRTLRQSSFVVHFPPTSSSKLAQRLMEISKKQSIRTDMTTLSVLCEKANNDIRSCISTLHFFKNKNDKYLKTSDIVNNNIGHKDMQKSLFNIWQEIFQIPIANKNILMKSKDYMDDENISYNPKNMARLQKIVQSVQSFGDYDRLAQGVHENMLKLRYNNAKQAILRGTEWFCWMDQLSTRIRHAQDFVLMAYIPYAFAAWHFQFASMSWPKIAYPNVSYENYLKETKCKQITNDVVRGLLPKIRAFTHSQQLILDILPLLLTILSPTLRPVNIQLYNQREKQEFGQLMNLMIDYNLNYIQERSVDGQYFYHLDPNIEELTKFELEAVTTHNNLSYNFKQMISREVELEKVRRTDGNVAEDRSTPAKNTAPNNLQKLTPKQIKVQKDEPVQFKDFFGRVIQVKKSAAETAAERDNFIKGSIWYCYKEGYNNAVKKDLTMADLM